jgi:cytochrome c-type biogenesis protein CcmH/NrfG
MLARLEVATGRLEAAEESFRRAAELDPGDVDLLVEWIRLAQGRGASETARKLALRVRMLEPEVFEREGLSPLVE